MHEVYAATSVIDRLPYTIESISAYGDRLIVGTKNGFALVYKVKPQGDASQFHVNLEQANKSFSKKAVAQLEAIPELDILISLSDSTVTVHELGSLKQLSEATASIGVTRGAATVFAIDVQVLTNIHGAQQCSLKLCVSVKKRLYLYLWKNGLQLFQEIRSGLELSLPDIPRVMSWCRNSICVGFKRDYYMYEIDSAKPNELFPTGRNLDPLMARIGVDKLALNKDNISVLIDHKRQPTQKYGITWSETPVAMVYRAPYLIGILSRFVEVRTIERKHVIQTIALDKPRMLTHTRDGQLYVGSATGVWRLVFLPIAKQLEQLIQNKEFELALLLCESDSQGDGETTEEHTRRLDNIKNLHAFELFSQKRYEDSIKIFTELRTDPSHVIGLYPDLLPREFGDKIRYPRQLEDFSGADRENAIASLIDYLTLKRADLLKLDKEGATVDITPLMESSKTVKTVRQLSQIIDTTLLKCYLEINDALVAPLLRLKDNNCHIEESEKVLKRRDKLDELIILYETKQEHRKALSMLYQQALRPGAPETLKGVERTVCYLRQLGKKHVDIILEFANWVIKSDPEKGLSIFTDELLEKAERLPIDKVLTFLLKQADGNRLVISYLKHAINEWQEENSDYHDMLVNCYREEVTPLLEEYITCLPEGQIPAPAGEEGAELGDLRGQLLHFLQTSKHYKAERLLKTFPYEYYHEERAVLLGRCGHHKQALFIYVHLLQRPEMAEDYCRQYYSRDQPGDCDVYVHLLGYYLRPLDSVVDARQIYGSHYLQAVKPNTTSAMRILRHHSAKLDSRKVLELLPDEFSLREILPYLESMVEKGETRKRQGMVLRNLLQAEKLSIERSRIYYEKTKFTVTERSICYVCHNKISTSSFARHSNNTLAHLSCVKASLDAT